MDWKTVSNNVLLVGLFVAMVTTFNQVNGRLDTMNEHMNRRFDLMQAEMNRRFDTMQAENQRQHDAMQEVLRVFEGPYHAPRRESRCWPRKRRITSFGPSVWARIGGFTGERPLEVSHLGAKTGLITRLLSHRSGAKSPLSQLPVGRSGVLRGKIA